jgi:cullin-4
MKKALDDYEAFYKDRHSARRLTWAYYLATATLSARYPQRNYEISVSLYQAAILLLFNERDTWTVEEIRDRLLLSTCSLLFREQCC